MAGTSKIEGHPNRNIWPWIIAIVAGGLLYVTLKKQYGDKNNALVGAGLGAAAALPIAIAATSGCAPCAAAAQAMRALL